MKACLKYIAPYLTFTLFAFAVDAQSPWLDSVKQTLLTQKQDTNKVIALIMLSDSYRTLNPDSAFEYGLRALHLAEKLEYERGVFMSVIVINGALTSLGNYPLQLEYCFKALSLAKKTNTADDIANANGVLSDYYYNLGEYRISLAYMQDVNRTIMQSCPDATPVVWVYLSKIYEGMNKPDSAILYGKKAYERVIHEQQRLGDWMVRRNVSCISWILGHSFTRKELYDSALYYYRLGDSFSRDHYLELDMIEQHLGIAAVYKSTNHLDSAFWYVENVLKEKNLKTYPVGMLKALNLLAAIYELKNKPDSTLKYVRMAMGIKDSLFSRGKMIAIQNLTFSEQEKQKHIEASGLKMQNTYKIYFLIVGFITIFTIATVLLRNKRLKQLQDMRNRIADDLHDDIGSTLSSISIMSELAKDKSPQALPLLTSIGESTNSLQENMSDIVWAVNPKNDRFENVLERMNRFATEIMEAKNIELDFSSDSSLSSYKLTMGQRKNIYLFFKEVINNAAKYSNASKVVVRITRRDHSIEMRVSDNGKGFDADRVFNGNGMNTLRKRKTELDGDLHITSLINEGTCVQLKFKIT